MARKSAEQVAAEKLRYARAEAAVTDADFAEFFEDPNQAIRAHAAFNPNASPAVLERFAHDKFWGTQLNVIVHANVTDDILKSMLTEDERKRGTVHAEARKQLEARGYVFGVNGMPLF